MKKATSSKTFFSIFGGIFGGIGLALLIAALCIFIVNQNFKKNAEKVVGVITTISSYTDSDGDLSHEVYVSYQYDGITYNTRLNSYVSSWHEGSRIDLYVSPKDPYRVKSQAGINIAIIVVGAIGTVFFIIGVIFLCIGIKGRSRDKKLKETGKKLVATVTGGQECYNVTMNGKYPFKLDCMYQDEFTGESFLFSSDYVMTDPQNYVNAKIDVYVDPNQMSKYYVDLDSLVTDGPMLYDFR